MLHIWEMHDLYVYHDTSTINLNHSSRYKQILNLSHLVISFITPSARVFHLNWSGGPVVTEGSKMTPQLRPTKTLIGRLFWG